MAHSTIKGEASATVTLGAHGYHHRLVIASTGDVQPSTYGAAALIDPAGVRHGHIVNNGGVYGAFGGGYSNPTAGGVGIDFAAVGTLVNTGHISGGHGGYGIAGGVGVDLQAGGSITNTGAISGGEAGYGRFAPSQGAVGVILNGGTLTSSGGVFGGSGGERPVYYNGGGGGAAVIATDGALVTNSGTFSGGSGQYAEEGGGFGAAGVQLNAATLANSGTISGGGGAGSYRSDAGNGGPGVAMTNGAIAVNLGLITGGGGGYGSNGYNSAGGAGVTLHDATLANTGTIIGGGGPQAASIYVYGGAGVVVSGGTLFAGGTITGGAGGHLSVGGVGISISGGEAVVTGTITGGGGADAVSFGYPAGTLQIDPGAVFNGLVVAGAEAADVLVLGGTTSATLSGLGTEFTNFSSVQIASGAIWALDGANTLVTGSSLLVSGTLSVAGTLADTGTATISATGSLNPGISGAVLLGGVTLQDGRLTESFGGTMVIGTSLAGATAGTLTIQEGFQIAGDGIIHAPTLSIAGALTAQGGTLGLHAIVTGTGAITIDAGATLDVFGTLTAAGIDFASGGDTLVLGKPADVTTTLSGFGTGDTVDLQKIIATTLTYSGGTLTLLDGTTPVKTLILSGDYTLADFAVQSDGGTGTDVYYAAQDAIATAAPSYHVQNHAWPALATMSGWHDGEPAVVPWLLTQHGR